VNCAMNLEWKAVGATVRGASHLSRDLPNQDAWGNADGEGAACVAVSDGHGGKLHFRSATGARMAVEEAVAELSLLAKQNETPSYRDVQRMGQRVSERWNVRVRADLASNPLCVQELDSLEPEGRAILAQRPEVAYGSTLLAAAATSGWVAYLQLGDGDILAVDQKGATRRPLPGDPKLIGNRTTSLCQEDAVKQMRVRVESEMPALITLSTDGYANSFQTDADFLQIGPDYLEIVRSDRNGLEKRLSSILSEATRQGSSDDITLVLLLRAESREAVTARKPTWRRMLHSLAAVFSRAEKR
jgi:serine/threonine protein phosphatase PrpC